MSKKVRILISCVFVLFAFGAGIFAYAQTYAGRTQNVNADSGAPDYLVDKFGKIQVPAESGDADAKLHRGTEDNPLFILEIVPYDGMAEVGYLIDGQEPIDVHAMARNNDWFPGKDTFYTVVEPSKTFSYWPGEEPDNFKGSVQQTTQFGTMKYVTDESGQYTRTVTNKDADDNVISATYTLTTGGDFVWTPLSAEECVNMPTGEQSTYRTGFQNATNHGDTFKMCFDNVNYVTGTGYVVEHNDVFLRESVGLAYEIKNGIRDYLRKPDGSIDEDRINELVDNYHTVVYTVTPEDLNLNPALVDRADMIVLSSEANMGQEIQTYVKPGDDPTKGDYKYIPFLREGKFGYEEPNGTYGRKNNIDGATFKTNLLDWDIALKIYDRATDPQRICPVITDAQVYISTRGASGDALSKNVSLTKRFSDGTTINNGAEAGTQNNVAKLFLMLYQMTNPVMESFYGEVTYADHAMFGSEIMKDSSDNPILMKDGVTPLKTGTFLYDAYWPSTVSVSDGNSRIYWNDLTMLPWHVVPKDTSSHNNPSYYGFYMAMFGIMAEDLEGVNANITSGYAQNSIRNGLMQYDGGMQMTTNFDTPPCGVPNNEYGSEVYDFFTSITDPADLPIEASDLSTADCLYYLLNGLNIHPMITNKVYKILELQPTAMFENKETFWNPLIAAYTNSLEEPVVDTMTTSEFIGSHVECISDYDLIYMGMNKNPDDMTMNFTSGTNFVYAHTGPKIEVPNEFKALYGWLGNTGLGSENKEKYFVFSGNDLTESAYKKLKDYDVAEFPILFGNGFFTAADASAMANTIDRNSNVFKLGNEVNNSIYAGGLGNITVRGKLRAALAGNQKVEMYFASANDMPVIYDSHNPESQRYLGSDRTLRYKFTVKAPAGTTYKVKLYVDSNTDGMYMTGEEDVGASIYVINAHGNEVPCSDTVQAGKTYVVKRIISDRVGSVSWKLTLEKSNKTYAALSGVSAIKANATERKTIKVLQIVPKNNKDSVMLPKDEAEANSLGGASKMFYEKIQGLNDMQIIFEHKGEDEIVNSIKGTGTVTNPQYPDYLYDNYDMIVLGFGDTYDGVSDALLLERIEKFIEYGKAVLYTHDTSSGIGSGETTTFPKWGVNVTKRYRELFGMDRYGAKQYITDGTIPSGKDKPYKPLDSTTNYSSLVKNNNGQSLIQGVANGMLYRTFYEDMYHGPYPGELYNGSNQHDSNVNTKVVTRVNRGAITEYPYTIDEKIEVAKTHPQYYQLDMEKNGIVVWYCLGYEEQAVNPTTGALENWGLTKDTGLDYQRAYFKVTPNDVRSNYYIYNIGNVTYSGMGHTPWYADRYGMQVSEAEIELFVNTFVAAYRAAATPVTVKVTNEDATSNSAGDQFLCVDVDSSNPDEMIGDEIEDVYRLQVVDSDGKGYKEDAVVTKKSKRVFFRLVNNNSYGAASSKFDVKIVLNDGSTLDGVRVDGENEMFAVYRGDNGAYVDCETTKYEANTIYDFYVDVPINIEGTAPDRAVGETKLKMTVTLTYKIGEREFTKEGDTMVYIMPRGLFPLT